MKFKFVFFFLLFHSILFGQNTETSNLESRLNQLDKQRDSLLDLKFQLEIEDLVSRINNEMEQNDLRTQVSIHRLWGLSNDLNRLLKQKLSIASPEISNSLLQRLDTQSEGTNNREDIQLGSRNVISRPKPRYDCDGEGIVVVRIWVDPNGSVKKVEGGVLGSSTSNSCLVKRSEEAALKTRFEGDSNAPSLQTGTIEYRFYRQ